MSTTPQVLAWITCDSVYVDPATGKHTLLGIFSKTDESLRLQQPTDVSIANHPPNEKLGWGWDNDYVMATSAHNDRDASAVADLAPYAWYKPGGFHIYTQKVSYLKLLCR